MIALNNFFLNFSLGIWLGIMVCFSFLTTPTLFRELPREMAGEVVSKLFPQYYFIAYALLGISLVTLLLKGFLEKPFPILRLICLALAFAFMLIAGTQIHPKAHFTKTVMRTLEDGPEKEQKQAEFNKLHRQSVLSNVAVLLLSLLVFILNFTPLKL